MKYDFFHYRNHVDSEAGERYPILDWKFFYDANNYEQSYSSRRTKGNHGFTGKVTSVLTIHLYLFRHQLYFNFKWNVRQISPEQAFNDYHS